MPKIDVNQAIFYDLVKSSWKTGEEFEEALICAKAELDSDFNDDSLPLQERILKIELNDTNRPDLWSTAGLARQLKHYHSGKAPDFKAYPFFSRPGEMKKASRQVMVEPSVAPVRPYLAGFIASGKTLDDPLLRDLIQAQDKLAFNFGRRRRSVSVGIYRNSLIEWPIIYKGADPDQAAFVPLQGEEKLTLREILKQHPKGREFAFIQEHEAIHPLLVDSKGKILSYPPIINSADLGAVQVGDSSFFVELTGTDLYALNLAASIIACDLADLGFAIEPVEIVYQSETPFGLSYVCPYYFQEPVFCSLGRIEKFLGEKLSPQDCMAALSKMGVYSEEAEDAEGGESQKGRGVRAWPPEYRNDYLHAADVAEDIMIGRGLSSFTPQRPRDYTLGRLSPLTLLSRQLKEIMYGLGYQEMIYNYLGSRRDFVERPQRSGEGIIRISNPMTESYEYLRDGIIPSLLLSESVSGHSVYPHRIFEIGKVAFLDREDNYGSVTRQFLGFLEAQGESNFNTMAAQIQTLFYYLSKDYKVEEAIEGSFIPGRAAAIVYNGRKIGVYGEIHPQVLENYGITMPCTAAELDLEALL